MTSDDFFAYTKTDANSLVRGESISTFLSQFISFFVYGYSMITGTQTMITGTQTMITGTQTMITGTQTQVTLLDPLIFSNACVLSYIRADSMVVFCKRCYCCSIITVDMNSPYRYVLRRGVPHISGLPQFSLKHCREATHNTTLPVAIPWSINTCHVHQSCC